MSRRPVRRFRELGVAWPPVGTRIVMRRAVVLGGSIAGLLAARVLSDHADEVIVLERDDPDAHGARPGVPQGAQVHVLLHGGRVQLDRWFPGFSEGLLADGAVLSKDDAIHMYVDGTLKVPVADEIVSASRPFLESRVRARTLALRNVRLIRARARGLTFATDRVTGVRYTAEGDPADAIAELPAELVVDAMGRSSRLGDWLEEAGRPRPPMRRVGIDLGYATASFRRDGAPLGVSTVQSVVQPGAGRRPGVCVLTAVEDGRWSILLSGFADDRPTRDPEEFRARCRRLPPFFGWVAEGSPMIGPVVTYRQADSRRRDFHAVRRLPAGLVAVGDAVASFNPVYGQGMSSAALHASCLSAYLRSAPSLAEPARDYFARVRLVVDAAWQTSTTNDLALPHVTGPYPRGFRVAHRISDLILRASVTDAEINHRFLQVTHMRAHPNTLIRPGLLLRAMRADRGRTAEHP
ncbi:FAD-dependent oxidoreductase [Spirillospora sp. CA-142024]|uniref:FAD-dependent oxidoreductase n=1 Tax=Spirillospora sp. CA-142024 TaxID=3240036 RepID=UPI003D8DA0F9